MNTHAPHSTFRRRNVVPFVLALSASLVAVCGLSYSRAQETEEREVIDKIPKHLPIKVKIRKPEKLKDAKNDDWLDDIEIEVTNTGTKPIYYLHIRFNMPDVLAPNGIMYAFTYRFGRSALVAWEEPVRPDDVPLRPGETITLNPPANHIAGWKGAREEGRIKNPKKIEFVFGEINFGDGTGFAGRSGTPMPVKRQRSLNDPSAGGSGSAGQAVSMADPPPRNFMDSSRTPRPTTPPVSFFPAAFSKDDLTAEPKSTRDICCQTSRPECLWMKLGEQTCTCGVIQRMQFPACSDPFGACFTIEYSVTECEDSTGFKHFCETSDYGEPCETPRPGSTPTPTPTPPPGSTPTPSPTPTPIRCPDPKPASCCQPVIQTLPGSTERYCTWDCTPCPPNTPLADGCITPDYSVFGFCPVPGFPDFSPIVYGGECCQRQTGHEDVGCENPGTCDTTAWGWDASRCCCANRNTGECDSPVLLDVLGDGFRLTDAAGGVLFDFDGDGAKERLAWTAAGADDAWLVLDRDGNGTIDSGRELFGNLTPQPFSSERNGFRALAVFDSNADGRLDAGDAVFPALRLWRDSNHDGVSQPGELYTLPALDVTRIHLSYKESKREDEFGNRFRFRAKVDDAKGAKVGRWAWDVFLLRAP
jgi:hypothetical protein